ncbi:MAG: hypothetical protein IPJ33_04495 [Gammaproteobacteria bacterium]|nr:hypothetical protein [Gammaproteobacteria bacterium]
MGLKFDESMTSAAYVDNEVRSSTYGQITIGKSFFVGGNTTPELAKHYPGYSSWLTRQPLRSWQMFVARHEIQHLFYENRKMNFLGPRADQSNEIEASRIAVEWVKSNGL